MNEILKFIWSHKTKAIGTLTVVAGAALTMLPQLQQYMSPARYAFSLVGLGVTVTTLGFLNRSTKEAPPNA